MATTGAGNGTLTKIEVGAVVINNLTVNSISIGRETFVVTTKDSAGWRALEFGVGSGTITGSGIFAEDAVFNFKDLFALISAKTKAVILSGSAVVGDEEYSFSGLITNITRTDPLEDASTFDFTFESDGAVTEAVAV